MQINITGRHVEATDNVKAHITDKLGRCLSIFSEIETVHVILDKERHENIAEVIVHGTHHMEATAKEHSENLYDAIDRAIEHAERQLHKKHDKKRERIH